VAAVVVVLLAIAAAVAYAVVVIGDAEKEVQNEGLSQSSCAIEREGALVTVIVAGLIPAVWCDKLIREWSGSRREWRYQRKRTYPKLGLVCEMANSDDSSQFRILDGASSKKRVCPDTLATGP
jgi:hypothetical protein